MYSYGKKNLIFSIWLKMPAIAFMISLLSPAASKSLKHSEYLAIDERILPFWNSSAASASFLAAAATGPAAVPPASLAARSFSMRARAAAGKTRGAVAMVPVGTSRQAVGERSERQRHTR